MIYIGIDPGKNGGIAAIDGQDVRAQRMPDSDRDLLDLLYWYVQQRRARAVLEHVWSVPGQGGGCKFGVEIGRCRMALTAACIPFDLVLPRKWQKEIGVVYPPGAGDTEKKNITKRRAQQLFPSVTPITHHIADALLLAEYARRRAPKE